MFDGFETRRISTAETEIHLRLAGEGPPVLLLHGYPQTHACWHAVAPQLTGAFTVVVPDLRGYGDSGCPASDPEHKAYSKRAMANDMVEVMAALGFETFAVVGHDRGARVAYRLTLDHPERVTHLVSLDVVTTLDMWEATDKARAIGGFHWPFLAQPAPFPEKLIGGDPEYFAEWLMRKWAADGFQFNAASMAEYKRCFAKPEVIRATCEDYRAGAAIDMELDLADRQAGRRITCPMLFLWGGLRGFGGVDRADPVDIWRAWADDVSGGPLPTGHFLPEEAPDDLVARLKPFLSAGWP